MPKDNASSREVTNHPCHLLSLPSAKRFWCRHCMSVFEDAITRWRHSRSCRYGAGNNFIRRRELEAKALQNTTALSPMETGLGQSIQMSDLASGQVSQSEEMVSAPNEEMNPQLGNEAYTCFICHKQFDTMEAMRAHVKYPCSASKIITSRVPHPKHSMPVFLDELPGQGRQWQASSNQSELSVANSYVTSESSEVMAQNKVEELPSEEVIVGPTVQESSDSITPTNIYVNEQGETVIEVENLDLNSEGGELSLAHLLTQLSQQGIVFDKSRTEQLQQQTDQPEHYKTTIEVSEPVRDEEEEQPTAEDAANTLAQLAGFRSYRSVNATEGLVSGSMSQTSVYVEGQSSETSTEDYTMIKSQDGSVSALYSHLVQPQHTGQLGQHVGHLGQPTGHLGHHTGQMTQPTGQLSQQTSDLAQPTSCMTSSENQGDQSTLLLEELKPVTQQLMKPDELKQDEPVQDGPVLAQSDMIHDNSIVVHSEDGHLVSQANVVDENDSSVIISHSGQDDCIESPLVTTTSASFSAPVVSEYSITYTGDGAGVSQSSDREVKVLKIEPMSGSNVEVSQTAEGLALGSLQEIIEPSGEFPQSQSTTIYLTNSPSTCSSTTSAPTLITEESGLNPRPFPSASNVSTLPMPALTSGQTAVYMVTSTGIQPVNIDPSSNPQTSSQQKTNQFSY